MHVSLLCGLTAYGQDCVFSGLQLVLSFPSSRTRILVTVTDLGPLLLLLYILGLPLFLVISTPLYIE